MATPPRTAGLRTGPPHELEPRGWELFGLTPVSVYAPAAYRLPRTGMAEDLEDEVEEPEALEPDLEDLPDDEDLLADDDVLEEDEDALTDEVLEEEEEEEVSTDGTAPVTEEEEEEEEEAEDEDVEASLDVILKERLVVAEEEEEEEDEDSADVEDRSETAVKVLPKQPDEFVCQSCFLVKHPSQLADAKRGLCRDCV